MIVDEQSQIEIPHKVQELLRFELQKICAGVREVLMAEVEELGIDVQEINANEEETVVMGFHQFCDTRYSALITEALHVLALNPDTESRQLMDVMKAESALMITHEMISSFTVRVLSVEYIKAVAVFMDDPELLKVYETQEATSHHPLATLH